MKDRICHFIARKLPKRVTYWCGIVLFANATSGKYSKELVPEILLTEALDRWIP